MGPRARSFSPPPPTIPGDVGRPLLEWRRRLRPNERPPRGAETRSLYRQNRSPDDPTPCSPAGPTATGCGQISSNGQEIRVDTAAANPRDTTGYLPLPLWAAQAQLLPQPPVVPVFSLLLPLPFFVLEPLPLPPW